MKESTGLQIEELKLIRANLLADVKSDLLFSKIYLSLSSITPLLITIRKDSVDIKSLLLNYLIIGIPLVAFSIFLEKDTVKKMEQCKEVNETIEFLTDEEEPIEYTALYNKIKSKNMKKD